jgi:hypothetical protein
MPSRYLGFWIVGVEIHVWENTAIGVPASNMRVCITEHEFFAG